MLRLNTMPAADGRVLEDPGALRPRSARHLRKLGRLPYPMVWRRGESGYRRVPWDEALDVCADALRRTVGVDPDRVYFYMTSRGMPNETYFVFNKVARFLGTGSAPICSFSSAATSPTTSRWR